MMEKKYKKNTSRVTIKFVNGKTNELLFEISDRTWMNMGEVFADGYADELIKQTIVKENLPENIIILAVASYNLV